MSKFRNVSSVLVALLFIIVALAGCGGGGGGGSSVKGSSTGPTSSPGSTSKILSATQASPFVTDLIAGGGDYYGPPKHESEAQAGSGGTVVGDVKVWNDGTNLHVLYETTGVWTLDQTHLYVGTVIPPDNHPGQFPWVNEGLGDVTSYEYVLPLSGTYPNHGFDANLPYNWTVGADLDILAQAEVCETGEGGGGGGGPANGIFATFGLWGYNENTKTDLLVGQVTFAINGSNLVCDITSDFPDMNSTHLSVGVNPPSFAPGSEPWKHDGLGGATFDEFIVALSGTYPDGTPYNFTPGECLFFCVEVNGPFGQYYDAGTADWATAWNVGNRFIFPHQKWRSYAELCLPGTGGGGGGGGSTFCDTAWGKGNGDGWATWFRNYSGFGNNNWGWWFNYNVTAP